jgi:hypothetical protein
VEPVLSAILAGQAADGHEQALDEGQEEVSSGRSATEAVAAASELTTDSTTDFVPVRRIFLACHHRLLATAYFFDFADDEADFTASSEQFNQVLASVRFLP